VDSQVCGQALTRVKEGNPQKWESETEPQRSLGYQFRWPVSECCLQFCSSWFRQGMGI